MPRWGWLGIAGGLAGRWISAYASSWLKLVDKAPSKMPPDRKVRWSARVLFGPIRSPFWWATVRSGAGAVLALALVFVFIFVFWVGGGIAAPENGEATDWARIYESWALRHGNSPAKFCVAIVGYLA
jgi:hypothetical protein